MYLRKVQVNNFKTYHKSLQFREFNIYISFPSMPLDFISHVHVSSETTSAAQKCHRKTLRPISVHQQLWQKLMSPDCQYHTCGFRVRTSQRPLSNSGGQVSRPGMVKWLMRVLYSFGGCETQFGSERCVGRLVIWRNGGESRRRWVRLQNKIPGDSKQCGFEEKTRRKFKIVATFSVHLIRTFFK